MIGYIVLVLVLYAWFRLVQEVIRMEDEMHKPRERKDDEGVHSR